MRMRRALSLTLAVTACYNSGPQSSGSSHGSSTAGGTTAGTGSTSTSNSSGNTGSSSGGSSTSYGLPTVTITGPDAGDCAPLNQSLSVNLSVSGFELSTGACLGALPCGVAIVEVMGPTGSCNQGNASSPYPPNVAVGTSPLLLTLHMCPSAAGPSGPPTPSGPYTDSVYLSAQSPENPTETLLALPDGGPLASETFIGTYNEGFTCEGDPEVVLNRPIDRRIDGIAIFGDRILLAENGGGDGDVISAPASPTPFGADAGLVFVVPPGTQGMQFWPSAISTDGVSAFITENNTPTTFSRRGWTAGRWSCSTATAAGQARRPTSRAQRRGPTGSTRKGCGLSQ